MSAQKPLLYIVSMHVFGNDRILKNIKKNPQDFYVIHYSCQSLYDDNEGLSPRITSIAITHLATRQTVSFSTHAVAEELKISRENVIKNLDEIERKLLSEFYNFIRDRRDKFWIHWNMRNLTYGFEHIQHRYRVLVDDNIPVIPVERRINLNDILKDYYGDNYAPHPRLMSLMELNGGLHRHFLSGKEEVQAFQNNEFIRMHNSTLCKVAFYYSIIDKMLKGRLRTSSNAWGVKLDKLFESRISKFVGLVATALTIALALPQIISFFD